MKNNPPIHNLEDSIKLAETKLHLKEDELNKISRERCDLMKKLNDLKNLRVHAIMDQYSVDLGSIVVMWAPHLDYHVSLITVLKLLEKEDEGDWGTSYKGVRTQYVLCDSDIYCKSDYFHIADTTLLHEIQKSETIVTKDEVTVDQLLLKMYNLCPTSRTYKEYQKLFTDNSDNELKMPVEN